MKLIKLTRGLFAQVDDHNYEHLNQFKWYAQTGYRGFYACRRDKGKFVYMHRYIKKTKKGVYCDHINHDTLCNLEDNLRNCTNSENGMNRKSANKNSKSGTTGVHWDKRDEKWIAQIMVNRTHLHIGRFKTIEEAIDARKKKEKEIFGEFANPNL